MRSALLITWVMSAALSTAQDCIQNLDSANYFKYRNPQKAKFYANTLLAELDSSQCPSEIGIASVYNNLGLLLWEIDEKIRGLEALKSGMRHELETKDSIHRTLLGPYYNLSSIYQEMGDFSQSETYLILAERVINQHYVDDVAKKVRLYRKKGIYHREVGNFEASLDALRYALSIQNASTDSLAIETLIELGTTFKHFGDLKNGETELLKAIELAKNTNEIQYLTAIDRLSTLKMEQGEYSDSENYLLYNLKKKNEKYTDDPILTLETLNGLGVLYHRLNDLESADEYITRALSLGRNARDIRPYLINNLGTIYMKKGELDKALDCFKESVEGFETLFGTANPDYASGLSNMASVLKQKGDLSKALNLYTHVLDLDKVIFGEDHQRYATSLNNVALIYQQLGNLSLAGKLLLRASEIRKEALGEYHPIYIKNLNDLGVYHLLQKDTVAAMENFNTAIKLEIKHMEDIFPVLTDRQRKLYFDEARYNIERFNSLAFSDRFLNTPYAEDALNHFLNTKGVLFYASEKMRRIIQNNEDRGVKRLYDSWKEKKFRLAQAYLLTEKERVNRKISIEVLEEECHTLEKSLAQKISAFAQEDQNTYHTWQEISNVLDENTAAVEMIAFRNYSVAENDTLLNQGFEDQYNYVAMVIKGDSVLIPVKLSQSLDLEKGFARYRNSLRYGLTDRTSFDIFWKDIDAKIGACKEVKFAPDGLFHKMNPSVYFDESRQVHMSDLYNITNLTSAKDLLYYRDKDLRLDASIFGNPDFSNIESENFRLNQLPGAEREAAAITDILYEGRRWKTQTLYFSDATEKKVKSLDNPGILHLATHGYFDDDPEHQNPLNSSGLFLSPGTTSDEDGKLTAYEAMNLSLDETKAVVLAACETGLGTIQNGEGVFGLQRALLVAGSESIILSLVKIDDQAAMNFMKLFYQKLVESRDPKVAFFSARQDFKAINKNPFNWGAYILVSKG